MKIAWFTPFAQKSAIGLYSTIMVNQLLINHDITVFAEVENATQHIHTTSAPVRVLSKSTPEVDETLLQSLHDFDIAIYNLGDYYPFHGTIQKILTIHPGITILHDLVMHHFYYEKHGCYPESMEYLVSLEYAHGEDGKQYGEQILAGQVSTQTLWSVSALHYNMALAAVRNSYAVITHSHFAQSELLEHVGCAVYHLDFPKPPAAERLMKTTSAGGNTIIHSGPSVRLLVYGMINVNKCVHYILEALHHLPRTIAHDVQFDIIGSIVPGYEEQLRALISKYQLENQVILHGFQPDEVLHDAINQADVIINLRNPHFGESSWSLLEAQFAGKPTIVWKHGYYDEAPDDTVVKVFSTDELQAALLRLCADPALRSAIGKRAREYAQATFRTEHTVEQLLKIIEETRYNIPVYQLTDTFAGWMHELGYPACDPHNMMQVDQTIARMTGDVGQ